MAKINTTNYYQMVHQSLDKYIELSKQNPFNQYIFVCDNPEYIEEALLKKSPLLFSIQTLSYDNFIRDCLIKNNCTKQNISTLQAYITLKQILNNQSLDAIFNKQSSYAKIIELLNIFKEFNTLDNIQSDNQKLDPYSKTKISQCFELYQLFLSSIENHLYFNPYLELENFNCNENTQYIFISDKIDTPRAKNLISRLNSDVIKISAIDVELNKNNKYLIETTPLKEIQSVTRHIQSLLDNGVDYNDIAVFYPNESYAKKLQDSLKDYNIPFNQAIDLSPNPIQSILSTLLHCVSENKNHFYKKLILNPYLKINFNLNNIKKDLRIHNVSYNNDYSNWITHIEKNYTVPLSTCNTINEFNKVLLNFINNECMHHDSTNAVQSTLQFDSNIKISLSHYIDYLNSNISNSNLEEPTQQHIKILSINLYQAVLTNPKYIYILGNNEGILPNCTLDVNLLLDIQRKTINGLTTSTKQNILNDLIYKHIFSNPNATIILSTPTFEINGVDVISNNIFNYFKNHCTKIEIDLLPIYKIHSYTHYLKNNRLVNLPINQKIDQYINTKNQPNNIQSNIKLTKHLSVSKLECFRKCPYQYLHSYIIKPYIHSDVYLQSNELGTIMHEILEINSHYYKDKDHAKKQINQTEYLNIVEKQIEDIVKTKQYMAHKFEQPYNKYLLNKIKKDSLTIIQVLQQQKLHNNYIVSSLEQEIKVTTDDYQFNGVIDRIDELDDSFITIDYKAGKKKIYEQLVSTGFQIQLHKYACYTQLEKDKEIAAMLYFQTKKHNAIATEELKAMDKKDYLELYKMSGYVNDDYIEKVDNLIDKKSTILPVKFVIKKDSYVGDLFNQDLFDNQFDALQQITEQSFNSINQGEFKIKPTVDFDEKLPINPCKFCNYSSLCRFDVFYNEKDKINFNLVSVFNPREHSYEDFNIETLNKEDN